MRFVIILGLLVCAAQAELNVCEVGNSSEKCGPTQPYCQKGYECVDGNCCQAKERLCPHNQRSHGLCDDNGQCPDPGHQCFTTDDDKRVCCNKNQPKPKQRDCLSGKKCESSEDCDTSYACVEGSCCKNSDSELCPTQYYRNVFGCFTVWREGGGIKHENAKQLCASIGGELPLLSSKDEADELLTDLVDGEADDVYIQGSRSPGSSVWKADDGNPLPSLPSRINNENTDSFTALVFKNNGDGTFSFEAVDPEHLVFLRVFTLKN